MKKISLHKETVRRLNDHHLGLARGGKPTVCDTYQTICERPYTFVDTVITCVTCETCETCESCNPGICGEITAGGHTCHRC